MFLLDVFDHFRDGMGRNLKIGDANPKRIEIQSDSNHVREDAKRYGTGVDHMIKTKKGAKTL